MSVSLKPLKLGSIEIVFPVVLAALAGYSDWAFRLICRSCSAPDCATDAMLDRPDLVLEIVRAVLSAADALRMIVQTGVDGVIAAHSAIGNPWIFRQARDLPAGQNDIGEPDPGARSDLFFVDRSTGRRRTIRKSRGKNAWP